MRKSDIFIFILFLFFLISIIFNVINIATVQGVSMYPIFQNGQITFYIPTNNADVGDIIIYKSPTKYTYVIHKVIQVNNFQGQERYVTQGVNPITNPYPDTLVGLEPQGGVPQNYVVGKVVNINKLVFSIPYLGYLSLIFSGII